MNADGSPQMPHRYQLIKGLGQGGLARTYLAQDLVSHRRVVLKTVANDGGATSSILRREFRILRGVSHPCLPEVFDVGWERGTIEQPGFWYYSARFVAGVTLLDFAKGKRWQDVEPALIDVTRGLMFLHALGIRHGDVKPANIVVDPNGHATLIDLSCGERRSTREPSEGVSGTLGFTAPELLKDGAADARSDLYALGITLRCVERVLVDPLPTAVQTLCTRLTQTDPAQRPSECKEILELLGVAAEQVPPALLLKSSFVGREQELEQLLNFVSAALNKQAVPKLACIHGPPGVGSTRLLEELKWRLQETTNVVMIDPRAPDAIGAALRQAGATLGGPLSIAELARCYEQLLKTGTWVFICDRVELLEHAQRQLIEALARLVDTSGAIALVVASHEPFSPTAVKAHQFRIPPLTQEVVQQWVKPLGTLLDVGELQRVSHGLPASIISCCLSPTENGVPICASFAESWEARFAQLAPEPKKQLLQVLVWDELAPEFVRPTDADSLEALAQLCRANWIERRADGWVCTPLSASLPLESVIGASAYAMLHRQCGKRLQAMLGDTEDPAQEVYRAHLCMHQAIVQDDAPALELLKSARTPQRGWEKAADHVVRTTTDAEACLICAQYFEHFSQPARAIGALIKARKLGLPDAYSADFALVAARSLLAMGKTRPALRRLRQALRISAKDEVQVALKQEIGLALLKEGRGDEAEQYTMDALPHATGPMRLELLCNAALALSYQSRFADAKHYVEQALDACHQSDNQTRRFRALSARAMIAFRQGRYADAASDYAEALTLARRTRLDDATLPLLISYATSCQQTGMLMQALDAYNHGYTLAAALGESSRKARLSYNLATVYIALGQLDRAQDWANRSHAAATASNIAVVAVAAQLARAEIAWYRRDVVTAELILKQVIEHQEQQSTERESIEALLLHAQILVNSRQWDQAKAVLHSVEPMLEQAAAADMSAQFNMQLAELAMHARHAENARHYTQLALNAARETGQPDRLAELHRRASDIFQHLGEPHRAAEEISRSQELIVKIADTLPDGWRSAFEQHPRWRADSPADEIPRTPVDAADLRVEIANLRRLLEINRRINSAVSVQAVLQAALDAAIELTGAERGFLILNGGEPAISDRSAPQTSLRLAASVFRNMDESVMQPKTRAFSRTIATRVVKTGKPLLMLDAANDTGLDQAASVHALQLKSVLCVPVRNERGVVGALYMDDRVHAGTFGERETDWVSAIAEQVGIALRKADLMEQLAQRAEMLEQENSHMSVALQNTAHRLERLQRLLSESSSRNRYPKLVGESSAMQRVYDLLDRIVAVDATVLITGESGTGKELIARAIHEHGSRQQGPFMPLDCGALPAGLVEAELFGYRKGAFTGASRNHDGVFVTANQGTLFLDEIGELPLESQAKLLRVLQEREVKPIGADRAQAFDVRLLCATNRDLRKEVQAGRFREDLYYRLAVIEVNLPALRERLEDLPLLIEHILHKHARLSAAQVPELSQQALRVLMTYHWPGNIRQLENVLMRAALLADHGVIEASDVALGSPASATLSVIPTEKQRLRAALTATSWNVVEAAKLLAIPRASFYRKLRRHGLERPVAVSVSR